MPALPIEAANAARHIASVVARATGSTRVSSASRSGRRVIAGGAIAGIVIGAVALLALLVLAFCLFRRHKKQRARRAQETNKYSGDGRSSFGSTAPPQPQPYDNNNNPNMAQQQQQQGGYNYGQGYGYAHTAAPGQYGYGAQPNNGMSGVPPAHAAGHVHSTH